MTNFKYIKYYIKNACFKIKCFFQRGFKGYSEADVNDIKHWFFRTVPNILEDLSDNLISYPDRFEYAGEWQDELRRMAYIGRRSNWKYCYDHNLDYSHIELNKNREIFLEWFVKNFEDFWN